MALAVAAGEHLSVSNAASQFVIAAASGYAIARNSGLGMRGYCLDGIEVYFYRASDARCRDYPGDGGAVGLE